MDSIGLQIDKGALCIYKSRNSSLNTKV